jgi:hypothetical protein
MVSWHRPPVEIITTILREHYSFTYQHDIARLISYCFQRKYIQCTSQLNLKGVHTCLNHVYSVSICISRRASARKCRRLDDNLPVYPGGQVHEKASGWTSHVPPFLQWSSKHSLTATVGCWAWNPDVPSFCKSHSPAVNNVTCNMGSYI